MCHTAGCHERVQAGDLVRAYVVNVEFRIPEPGMYGLVDHDRLSYVPYGMVMAFDATGGHVHGTK